MNVDDKIYSGLTHIGTVAYVQFKDGESGDFSIITMEGNHTSDAQSKDGTVSFVSHGVFNTPEIGAKVMKYTENGGFALAEICKTDVTQTIQLSDMSEVQISELTETNLLSGKVIPGDSGGGVFHKFSDGRYYFCGVICYIPKDGTPMMTFSSVGLIPLECGIDYV